MPAGHRPAGSHRGTQSACGTVIRVSPLLQASRNDSEQMLGPSRRVERGTALRPGESDGRARSVSSRPSTRQGKGDRPAGAVVMWTWRKQEVPSVPEWGQCPASARPPPGRALPHAVCRSRCAAPSPRVRGHSSRARPATARQCRMGPAAACRRVSAGTPAGRSRTAGHRAGSGASGTSDIGRKRNLIRDRLPLPRT